MNSWTLIFSEEDSLAVCLCFHNDLHQQTSNSAIYPGCTWSVPDVCILSMFSNHFWWSLLFLCLVQLPKMTLTHWWCLVLWQWWSVMQQWWHVCLFERDYDTSNISVCGYIYDESIFRVVVETYRNSSSAPTSEIDHTLSVQQADCTWMQTC